MLPLLLFLLKLTPVVWAGPKIPDLDRAVIDSAHILTPAETQSLEGFLVRHKNLAQVEIWLFPSLENSAIEEISIHAAEKWKLGKRGKDNGVLILVAVQEHQIRMEVGRGLEGTIPDAVAGRIIDQKMKPAFSHRKYFDGLSHAVLELMDRIRKDVASAAPGNPSGKIPGQAP